jgi:hypothetical protein
MRFGIRRRRKPPSTHPQGEEYEIEKAEQDAQKKRDRFTASLFEKLGHSHFPFLKDPFE